MDQARAEVLMTPDDVMATGEEKFITPEEVSMNRRKKIDKRTEEIFKIFMEYIRTSLISGEEQLRVYGYIRARRPDMSFDKDDIDRKAYGKAMKRLNNYLKKSNWEWIGDILVSDETISNHNKT